MNIGGNIFSMFRFSFKCSSCSSKMIIVESNISVEHFEQCSWTSMRFSRTFGQMFHFSQMFSKCSSIHENIENNLKMFLKFELKENKHNIREIAMFFNLRISKRKNSRNFFEKPLFRKNFHFFRSTTVMNRHWLVHRWLTQKNIL